MNSFFLFLSLCSEAIYHHFKRYASPQGWLRDAQGDRQGCLRRGKPSWILHIAYIRSLLFSSSHLYVRLWWILPCAITCHIHIQEKPNYLWNSKRFNSPCEAVLSTAPSSFLPLLHLLLHLISLPLSSCQFPRGLARPYCAVFGTGQIWVFEMDRLLNCGMYRSSTFTAGLGSG